MYSRLSAFAISASVAAAAAATEIELRCGRSMDEGGLWQACEPHASPQHSIFSMPHAHSHIVPQSPFLPCSWGSDAWLATRADDIHDMLSPWGQSTGPAAELYPGSSDLQEMLPVEQMIGQYFSAPPLTNGGASQCQEFNLQSAPKMESYGGAAYEKLLLQPGSGSQFRGQPVVSGTLGMFGLEAQIGHNVPAGLIPSGGSSGPNTGLMQMQKQQAQIAPHAHTVAEIASTGPSSSMSATQTLVFNTCNKSSLSPPEGIQRQQGPTLQSVTGPSTPHKVDSVKDQSVSGFNPGPYVYSGVERQENLGGRGMWFQPKSSSPVGLDGPQAIRFQTTESAGKWPVNVVAPSLDQLGRTGGLAKEEGGGMVSSESGRPKCVLPRSTPPNIIGAGQKRPIWPAETGSQCAVPPKKAVPKYVDGCSRLEAMSAAAHRTVAANTSGGRALGTNTASGRALGPALNTNLKPRARQGSANDPQSIAARVRRERISDRLKTLQALIPNGDKVDMVTMLEKAINYVQCLELQIRMLKDDSMWPKALGALPNTLQELLELAGPEFSPVPTEERGKPKSSIDVMEEDPTNPPPSTDIIE